MTSDLSQTAAKEPTMTNIGPKPIPEMYATGLEIDCQCARCGSSMDYERCTELGCEDGQCYDWDDDGFDDLDPHYPCDTCGGEGGWHRCMSSPDWCKDNPLEGRENVKRGEIEWFTVPEGK